MKTLLSAITVLFLCFGLSARAQTVSGESTRSVTSTIRVRIPDFASIMLKENTTSVRSVQDAGISAEISGQSELPEFSSRRKWIRHTERLKSKKNISENHSRNLPSPALTLIHTATPE